MIVSYGGIGDGFNGCVFLCSVVIVIGFFMVMVMVKGKLYNFFVGFFLFCVVFWIKDDFVLFDFKMEKGKFDICC